MLTRGQRYRVHCFVLSRLYLTPHLLTHLDHVLVSYTEMPRIIPNPKHFSSIHCSQYSARLSRPLQRPPSYLPAWRSSCRGDDAARKHSCQFQFQCPQYRWRCEGDIPPPCAQVPCPGWILAVLDEKLPYRTDPIISRRISLIYRKFTYMVVLFFVAHDVLISQNASNCCTKSSSLMVVDVSVFPTSWISAGNEEPQSSAEQYVISSYIP